MVIHPAEHYDRTQTHLTGPQAMRMRHLKKMGFKVMELNYQEIGKLRKDPLKLREYLYKKYHQKEAVTKK